MIISLISQKGGVGKSAIARLLAVEFVRANWSVKIADLDTMQGTSTKWKARRDRAQIQPEIPVEKFATVERAVKEAERFDLLILDGPAHAEKGGRVMAKVSDLVLMPTCYGLDDLEAQVEAAYELEEGGALVATGYGSCSPAPVGRLPKIKRRENTSSAQKSTFLSQSCLNCRQSGRVITAARRRRRSAFRSFGRGQSRSLLPWRRRFKA